VEVWLTVGAQFEQRRRSDVRPVTRAG